MGYAVSKSRTFAVVLEQGGALTIHFLVRKQTQSEAPLLSHDVQRGKFTGSNRDALIELLVKAGLTVRFYDPEEKQWMDHSTLYGLVRAPGERDGTWGTPLLEEFESDYLKTV